MLPEQVNVPRISEMPSQHPGMLVVFTGPTAAGKDTLLNLALARFPWMSRIVTDTTRPRRDGEVNGRHYNFFASEEEFLARKHLERYPYPNGWKGSPLDAVLDIERKNTAYAITLDLSAAGNIERIIRDNCEHALADRVVARILTICVGVPRLTVLHDRFTRRHFPEHYLPANAGALEGGVYSREHTSIHGDIRGRLRLEWDNWLAAKDNLPNIVNNMGDIDTADQEIGRLIVAHQTRLLTPSASYPDMNAGL